MVLECIIGIGGNMVIGIDLDDTITNSFEDLMPLFARFFNLDLEYCIEHKYSYNNFPVDLKDRQKEFFKYLKENRLLSKITVKEDAIQVLKELRDLGFKIIIITSRNDSLLPDAYTETKKYLDENGIPYDELYCEHDKHKILVSEGVDVFIDDSLKGLLYNKDACTHHILFNSVLNIQEETYFKRASSWRDIKTIVTKLNKGLHM